MARNDWRVEIRDDAKKNLKKIPLLWRDRIEKAVDILANNPFYGEKMSGELKDRRKIRIWPYRIIYRLFEKEEIIYIERIDHRGSIGYK